MGITSTFVDELSGIHQGLQVAQQKGIQSLILQIDSMVVVQCMKRNSMGCVSGLWLIQAIQGLISKVL